MEHPTENDEEMLVAENEFESYDNIENPQSKKSEENLFLKFSSIIKQQLCFPERQQQTTQLSDLPPELILCFLKYVIETTNLKTWYRYAAVCRGWYLCLRNPCVYRQECSRLWSKNTLNLEEYGGSWKRMLIERLPIFTLGCYVTTIDNNPHSGKCYYYLKFFPDGRFMHFTSYDSPAMMTPKRWRMKNLPINAVWGYYRYLKNELNLVFFLCSDIIENNLFDYFLKRINTITLEVQDHENLRNPQLFLINLQIILENNTKADLFTQVPPFKYFV